MTAVVNQRREAPSRVPLAEAWRECGHVDRLIKALAKEPVSD